MKALVNRNIRYKGDEYRLRKGREVSVIPEELLNMLVERSYVEKPEKRVIAKAAEKPVEKTVEEQATEKKGEKK